VSGGYITIAQPPCQQNLHNSIKKPAKIHAAAEFEPDLAGADSFLKLSLEGFSEELEELAVGAEVSCFSLFL
jgi:hypothetical protein